MSRKGFEDLPDLETERLLLRKMCLYDAEDMFLYASDPELTRYVSWETHRSLEDSKSFLKFATEGYERGDFGSWGIVMKESGAFVGTCGLDVEYEPDHRRAELGYVISRDYWERGLMTEAVKAVVHFGFEELSLNRIQARYVAENRASARVMEKAGMTYESTLRQHEFLKKEYQDVEIYSVLWKEHRRL